MYQTILVPTDGSDHAATVTDHAIDIAASREATLHTLSVVDDRAFLVLGDDRVESVREELEETALEAVDAVATVSEDQGIATETAVAVGHPAEEILEYAAANDVDLIVMGTSGDDYERNVVGSISERVVRTSPVPVLTVGRDV